MSEAVSWSLERRLRRRLLVVLIALWLLGTAAALLGVHHETSEVLDSALEETAQRLLALPDAALGSATDDALVAKIGDHEEYVVYQLFDSLQQLRLRSHSAPLQALAGGAVDGLQQRNGWRIVTLTRDDGTQAQVAESAAHRASVLWDSSVWMLAPLLALLPLAAWALHAVLRSAFRTLETSRRAIAQRAAQDLLPLPLAAAPAELQPLLDTVNRLMERVQALLSAERAFTALAAHELRTPLAAAQAQLQRLIEELPANAAALPRTRALQRQLRRLSGLSTKLLQLARVEAGVALAREPVDLQSLVRLVLDEFRVAAGSHDERWQVRMPAEPVRVQGDIDALGMALRNLVENAQRHAGASASLRLQLTAGGELSVQDDGPGVPPERLASLSHPFVRGDAPGEGSGLGLAIAHAVAVQSGGALTLRSPLAHGRGFAATLALPVVATTGAAKRPV